MWTATLMELPHPLSLAVHELGLGNDGSIFRELFPRTLSQPIAVAPHRRYPASFKVRNEVLHCSVVEPRSMELTVRMKILSDEFLRTCLNSEKKTDNQKKVLHACSFVTLPTRPR